MNELLSESTFRITKNENNRHMLGIFQVFRDGNANMGYSQTMLELTDYGLDALEKNLKLLLHIILEYKYPNKPWELTNE